MDEEIKILCVDDEPNVLSSLKRLFLDGPYDIYDANDATKTAGYCCRTYRNTKWSKSCPNSKRSSSDIDKDADILYSNIVIPIIPPEQDRKFRDKS